MKSLAIFILLLWNTTLACSQGHNTFSFWGTVGIGASSYTTPSWSTTGNVGLSVRLSEFTIKYKRNVNSEFAILTSQEQAKSHEVFLGYSIPIRFLASKEDSNRSRVSMYAGLGSLKLVTRGRVIDSPYFFGDEYEMISVTKICFPAELAIELRFSRHVGCSFAVFSTIGRFSPIYGGQINILLGYL